MRRKDAQISVDIYFNLKKSLCMRTSECKQQNLNQPPPQKKRKKRKCALPIIDPKYDKRVNADANTICWNVFIEMREATDSC